MVTQIMPESSVKILSFILGCFTIAVLAVGGASGQKTEVPRFADYSVAVRRGQLAALDLRSHPLARMYKTLIREQLRAEGVNFAGHYTLVSVGCGTGCSITGIIDAHTGRAYFPSELKGWTSIVGDYEIPEGEDQRMFRTRSRLLRAIGRPNLGPVAEERHGPSGIYYYEWTKNRLRLVKFTPVGSYPEADPPNNQ